MQIPAEIEPRVRALDVDGPITLFSYEHWREAKDLSPRLRSDVELIHRTLGDRFCRSDVVTLYQEPGLSVEVKFLAAMIWGHESGEGGKRDARGPWKVAQMFSDPMHAKRTLAAATLSGKTTVAEAYKKLLSALPRCGPNFFTKHLYFLGKATGSHSYPVILDNRVASGLARLAGLSSAGARIVDVSATRTLRAYLEYLQFVHAEAKRINCAPDQIEMYLFNAASDA